MIIDCGYKQNNFCTCYDEDINNTDKCKECPNKTEVYTDTDEISLLYDAFKDAKKEKDISEVKCGMAIFGHDSAMNNDIEDIYYYGYNLYLVLKKKEADTRKIYYAYKTMKLMKMSIPKRIKRAIRRINKTCKDKWWYE